jgi:hypothetical protein
MWTTSKYSVTAEWSRATTVTQSDALEIFGSETRSKQYATVTQSDASMGYTDVGLDLLGM